MTGSGRLSDCNPTRRTEIASDNCRALQIDDWNATVHRFPAAGDWKVAKTRRQECLRYMCNGTALHGCRGAAHELNHFGYHFLGWRLYKIARGAEFGGFLAIAFFR